MGNLNNRYAKPYIDSINKYYGFANASEGFNPSLFVNTTSNSLQLRFIDSDSSEEIYNYDLTNVLDNLGITTLSNTYGAFYFKRNNIVTLTIDFANVTVANGDTIGILPIGCRPAGAVYCRNGFDNQNGEFLVYSTGEVKYSSPTGSCTYGHATLTFVTL